MLIYVLSEGCYFRVVKQVLWRDREAIQDSTKVMGLFTRMWECPLRWQCVCVDSLGYESMASLGVNKQFVQGMWFSKRNWSFGNPCDMQVMVL